MLCYAVRLHSCVCMCICRRVELTNTLLDFQPWASTFSLLERLFRFATTTTTLTSGDAVAARTIEMQAEDGEYYTGKKGGRGTGQAGRQAGRPDKIAPD